VAVGSTSLLQEDSDEYSRSDFKLTDYENGARTLGLIHGDVYMAGLILGMADDPRAMPHRTASAGRRFSQR
jgi:hypothetical protein